MNNDNLDDLDKLLDRASANFNRQHPAKKGRRAAAAQPTTKESTKDLSVAKKDSTKELSLVNKDSTKDLSLLRDEANETIDLFESRHYTADADESTQKPSAKRGGWGTDAELGHQAQFHRRINAWSVNDHNVVQTGAATDYQDERLRESLTVNDDSDTDIPEIPELEDDGIRTVRGSDVPMAPHIAVNRVATFKELDTELIRHTGFLSLKLQDGGEIDLKLLGAALSGETEVVEEDIPWEWDQVFTEVSSELLAEAEQQENPEE